MSILNISGILLAGCLLCCPCFAIENSLPDQEKKPSNQQSSQTDNTLRSIDDFLKNPSITVSGQSYSVAFDEELEKKLQEKNPTITAKFWERFDSEKGAHLSEVVEGVYFYLGRDETIYCETYLGENAK